MKTYRLSDLPDAMQKFFESYRPQNDYTFYEMMSYVLTYMKEKRLSRPDEDVFRPDDLLRKWFHEKDEYHITEIVNALQTVRADGSTAEGTEEVYRNPHL